MAEEDDDDTFGDEDGNGEVATEDTLLGEKEIEAGVAFLAPPVVVVISDPEAANSNKRASAASKLALSSSSDSVLSFRSFNDTEEAFVEDRNACVTIAIVASTSEG